MNIYCFKEEIVLISFLFFSLPIFSQQTNIDGFKQSLESISNEYPTNSDTVVSIFTQMLNNSDIKNDVEKYGLTLLYIGREFKYKENNVAKAKKMYEESLKIAQMNHKCALEINSRLHLVMLYRLLNNSENRIKAFEDLIELSKNCPEYNTVAYIHTLLGLAYAKEGNTDSAEKNYLKADSLLSMPNNFSLDKIYFTYSCIINFYEKSNKHHKSVYFAQKVLDNFYKKGIKSSNNNNINLYTYTSSIFKSIGEIDSALFYAHFVQNQSIKDVSEVNREAIILSNKVLSELYEQKGDMIKALFYERKYATLLDSMINLNGIEGSFDKVKALEDELTLQKKQNEIKSQRIIIWAISGLAAILFMFLALFYYNSKKLKRLNITLESQKQELTSLNDIRSRMFSILSHDLRSPIGALKNMIDLYESKIISKEEFDKYTTNLKQGLNGILTTLNNILDWSYAQLKGKKPFIEPLKVYQIIEDQLDLQAEIARQKGITLTNDIRPEFIINADFNQISLIIRNLVNNALKFTPQGGKVEINAYNTEGGKAIEVKDTGIGISEEKITTLFSHTAKRLNTTNNNGVGLGLQMINDFLKANNCTMTVKSKENEGSVFTLLFLKNEGATKVKIRKEQFSKSYNMN